MGEKMNLPTIQEIVDFQASVLDIEGADEKLKLMSDFQQLKVSYERKKYSIADELEATLGDREQRQGLHFLFYMNSFEDIFNKLNDESILVLIGSHSNAQYINLINTFYVPFIIACINNLKSKFRLSIELELIRNWLIEILSESEVTKNSINSKSNDIDAFVRTKFSNALPRGIGSKIKASLANNKKWSYFSPNIKKHSYLINEIKKDAERKSKRVDFAKIEATIKVGGIFRRAFKGISFSVLSSDKGSQCVEFFEGMLPSADKIERMQTSVFMQHDITCEFNKFVEFVSNELLPRKQQVFPLTNMDGLNTLTIMFEEFIHLLSCEVPTKELLFIAWEKARPALKNECDGNNYPKKIDITGDKGFEELKQGVLNMITDNENNLQDPDLPKDIALITLSLLVCSMNRVTRFQMNKLISFIQRKYPQETSFSELLPFSTCFDRGVGTIIDINRFTEVSQIIAISIKYFNLLSIKSSELYGVIPKHYLSPFSRIDPLLSNWLLNDSDKNLSELKKLNSLWRIDNSDSYELLRDIDFYINYMAIPVCESKTPGLYKYRNISDEKKQTILKLLDLEKYTADKKTHKNSLEAHKTEQKSFIGGDGLPIFHFTK